MLAAATIEQKMFSESLTLASLDLFPLRASGGVSPSMALAAMQTRPALLLSVTDKNGCTGYGEVWANFPSRANIHKQHLIEDVITPKLQGFTYCEPQEAVIYLRDTLEIYFLHIGQERVFEHILAGIDTALWDLALRSAGCSFAEHMGLPPHAQCYASSINPEDLEARFREHAGYGQMAFKLKLGFGDDRDIAFVERACRHCPHGARIMIDSNQIWQPDHAARMLKRLEGFNLCFAEEPLPANAPVCAWERLARATSIPLAAGENIYGAANFQSMVDAGVQYLQPDVAKWGGISGILGLVDDLPASVRLWPHFMGTAVGQMAALSISAAAGDGSVCEMDVNTNPLRTDLCGDILSIRNGAVPLPDTPGLVVMPESGKLSEFSDANLSL